MSFAAEDGDTSLDAKTRKGGRIGVIQYMTVLGLEGYMMKCPELSH